MRLSRYLVSMAVFLLIVAAVAASLIARLETAFLANPYLNALLIIVWLIGIGYIIMRTLSLGPEIRWVRTVQRNRLAVNELEPPPLMGSLARLMEDRTTPLMLTPTALRAVLDGIAIRLDEGREVARYLIGLMIFLGLLGTFWGLLKTVSAVGGVVQGLSMSADPTELFNSLKLGLEGPLAGMGTAFSSSLLGLAGSLVLGFLDLQLGQAQNRFFIDLEDWLFASVRDDRSPGGDRMLGEAAPSAYLQALVEQTAENIDLFRQTVQQAEESRAQSNHAIQALATQIGALAESGGDAALRAQMSAIEAILLRIAEDLSHGRTQALQEIRGEIKLLSRLIGTAIDRTKAD